jgi:hypothetical protein
MSAAKKREVHPPEFKAKVELDWLKKSGMRLP